ncbi:MAG: phage tail tape measure protein [Burkholderiaceae bacterium]|jgi:TP901 family phage tail tape measure protein|nr:phage tail tape measure protein [Burkholderiaceae bacterium]
MASSSLSLGLVFTATGIGAVLGAMGSVNTRIASIGEKIDKLKGQQRAALSSMEREWIWGGNAVQKYATQVEKLDREISKLGQRKIRIETLSAQHTSNKADLASRASSVAAVWGIGKMVGTPVSAFVRQDEAATDLQVAMMDKNGEVGKSYEALRKQAIELGNLLPGTTADFIQTATALMNQGMKTEAVLNGGLKAASYLAVVLKMPTEAAGTLAAKMREAFALPDEALPKMADAMQRAKFAFGMKPEDLMSATSYSAPMLNILGMTGEENMNKVLAIQGMGAQVGLEGSSFGTNFAQMLTRLAKGPDAIEMAKRGMKGKAKEIMDSMKITFDFFDKKGNFKGVDSMVKELEKLKQIKEKMGDKAAMEVADAMFGAEAGRPAMIIAEKGMAGYEEAQQRMKDQASLMQRIDKITKSSKNTWESLTGSVENFAAAATGPAIKGLHPLINLINDGVAWLVETAEDNPTLFKWIGTTVGLIAALAAGFLSLGVAASFVRYAWTGAQLLPGVARLALAVKALSFVRMTSGLLAAGRAFMAFGAMAMASPVTWILAGVAAIALGAWLIYNNWDKITGFFRKIWNDFKDNIKTFTSWFDGSIIDWALNAGKNLIDGLIDGISSGIKALKEKVLEIGSIIADTFSEHLGIQSPSRVFIGFGQNIGEGAAIGIRQSSGLAGQAATGLALATANAWDANFLSRAGVTNANSSAPSGAGAVVTFAPQITVQGGDPAAMRAQLDNAMQISFTEFESLMRRYEAENHRRTYGRNA